MKKLNLEEIKKLKYADSDACHYLIYEFDGGKEVYAIQRGGFESSMNGQFIATYVVPYGYYGEKIDQSKVDKILHNLKTIYPYAPQHDRWRVRQEILER